MWQGLSTSKMPRNVAMTIFTIKKGMLLSGSTNWAEKRAMKSTRVRMKINVRIQLSPVDIEVGSL